MPSRRSGQCGRIRTGCGRPKFCTAPLAGEVGELLGINEATLRNWVRRDLREGLTSATGSAEPAD